MSSTEVRPQGGTVATLTEFSDEEIRLVKSQLCKPRDREATDEELGLFLAFCRHRDLNPLAREVYAIFRWDGRAKREEMTIQAGIDGIRKIAARDERYAGQEGPYWCGADGQWRDIWPEGKAPMAAKVVVLKAVGGQIVRTPAVAHWAEYRQTDRSGNLMGLWRTMPRNQLAKCAEALALRKAFPERLGGVYAEEEMAQADTPELVATEGGDRMAQNLAARSSGVEHTGKSDIPNDIPDAQVVDEPPSGAGQQVTGDDAKAVEVAELERKVREAFAAIGMSDKEIDQKIANARGNERILEVLLKNAQHRKG